MTARKIFWSLLYVVAVIAIIVLAIKPGRDLLTLPIGVAAGFAGYQLFWRQPKPKTIEDIWAELQLEADRAARAAYREDPNG